MSTLNNITTQLDAVKTDIVACHNNLKANLVNKGVEVLPNDKMPSLIDAIKNINNINISENENQFTSCDSYYTNTDISIISTSEKNFEFKSKFKGKIKLCFSIRNAPNGAGIFYYKVSVNGNLKYDNNIQPSSSGTLVGCILDVCENDIVYMTIKGNSSANQTLSCVTALCKFI